MSSTLKAVLGETKVAEAVRIWDGAFRDLGRTDHGFDERMVWVDGVGVWLSAGLYSRKSGDRYWNGLGTVLGGRGTRRLAVEVNPPPGGQPPGRFQGVIALTEADETILLHRGEINAAGVRTNLKNHPEISKSLGFTAVSVEYSDGSIEHCHWIANLSRTPADVVASTKKFVDFCICVRSFVINGPDEAAVLQAASLFEEAQGSYIVGAQEEKEIPRVHADIWKGLRIALEGKGRKLSNERVGTLGPDLFTIDSGEKTLFEIKTSNSASDVLKAVGQLVVYEKALKGEYKKLIVLPQDVPQAYRSIIADLGIGVVTYTKHGNSYAFDL